MSTEQSFPEKSKQKLTTRELIHPRNLPEAAFQSYESFTNDADEQKESFINGEVRNPNLSYPKLESLDRIEKGIANLNSAIEQVLETEPDSEVAGIVVTSLEFRQAEMEYVKLFGRLKAAVDNNAPEEEVRTLAEEVRNLNRELYGAPQEKIVNSALGEVWSQIDDRRLSESAQQIYDDLQGMLPRPDTYEKLPDFNHPSLAWAGEVLLNKYANVEALLHVWWDDMVGEQGDDFVAHPEGIADAYTRALQLMDPEGASGVFARIDPDAKALSWESSEMVIVVGGKRGPIKSVQSLVEKFAHEGIVHGARAINGLKTKIPVLGTGLFTNTRPRPDYLVFEEGLGTTIEEVISNEEPQWDAVKLGHYINIALAENGGDFRAVFEAAWRYRLLMGIGDGEDVSESMIKKYKSQAYGAVVRIFRGTPTLLSDKYPDIAPVVYGKDGAYLLGRVLVMKHIAELYANRDEKALLGLLDAKFDPTIPEQAAIVAKYGVASNNDSVSTKE